MSKNELLRNLIKMKADFLEIIIIYSLITNSNSQETLFSCEFGQGDECGFIDDTSVPAEWILNSGPTPSRNTGPEEDHTDGEGYYLYAEATAFSAGDIARIHTSKIPGTAKICTTIRFFVHTYGADIGYLNFYVLGDEPYYFVSPLTQREGSSIDKWIAQEVTVQVSFDYAIAFEAIFRGSLTDNKGDMAIDDITIMTNNSCDIASCTDQGVTCLNGGTCVATDNGDDNFDYRCECVSGWSGDHCENDFDECASSPCNNGKCIHGLDSFSCDCYPGYYGETCEYVDMCTDGRCQNGGTCHKVENSFNCTCAPGYTGNVCNINIDDCDPNPCINAIQCVDDANDFQCICFSDYYGKRCQYLAGECDFEDEDLSYCGYTTNSVSLDWIVTQGKTPIPSVGPDSDHTTGEGFYVYAEVDPYEESEERATAKLISPQMPNGSVNKCTTITFWYFMSGDDVGTLNIYARTESNTREQPLFTLDGNQGDVWNKGTVSISSSLPYYVEFASVSKYVRIPVLDSYIALDDISVDLDSCDYDYCSEGPCKNNGICYSDSTSYTCECVGTWTGKQCTEDRNECTEQPPACKNGGACTDKNPGFECTCPKEYVGATCEYIKGSCDFDDPTLPKCDYQNVEVTPGFSWIRHKGATPTSLTGPDADHTLGTLDGYYLYVEATGVEDFSIARIVTPTVPYSGTKCTDLEFWFHMKGRDIGKLALYVQFDDELPTSPLWNAQGEQGNEWNMVRLNISVPNDFKLVFEAVVLPQSPIEPDNRGDIAIDDIVVHFGGNCGYDICFTKPCVNGATCVAIDGDDYRCDCLEGYDGRNCENIQACTPNPCQNGGFCTLDSDGEAMCLCQEEWVGDFCEITDPCSPNPCQNNGSCTRYQDTLFQCVCVSGYTGSTCQTDIDECASSPCLNGGECVDLVNTYECQCRENYIGYTCREIPGGCDFQNDYCGWYAPTEFGWTRRSGLGPNFPTTGPRYDHTYGNSSGYYVFTDLYKDEAPAGTRYQLQSPVFLRSSIADGKILTLEFFYNMYGPGIGTLNVYVINDDGRPPQLLSAKIQDDRLDWIRFAETVEPQTDFSILIEHETGGERLYLGDLAVDDISLIISDGVTVGGTTLASTEQTATQNTTCFNCVDHGGSGLSGGAIAGIVIGVVAAVALIAVGGLWLYRERRYKRFGRSSGMNIGIFAMGDSSS